MKNLQLFLKSFFTPSRLATLGGVIMALATAWIGIDWNNFILRKDFPILICSAVIALGGYITQIRKRQPPMNTHSGTNL